MLNLNDHSIQIAKEFETKISQWLNSSSFSHENLAPSIKESVSHSLLGGGKRFRPVLVQLTGEMLSLPQNRLWPFAMAVEMIHTYSLIHDDLPCMDNDDIRRGRPTNHKVFGEDIALLAGDLLLTEAFGVIAESYSEEPNIATNLIKLLVEAAGARGMVNGQILDIQAQKNKPSLSQVELLHSQKTGALIRVCVEGTAVIAGLQGVQRQSLRVFGENLGLAFQVADDILDHDEKDLENCSFTSFMSVAEAKSKLAEISNQALICLEPWKAKAQHLKDLVQFNNSRKV